MQDSEKLKSLSPVDFSALGMYIGKFVEQEINSSEYKLKFKNNRYISGYKGNLLIVDADHIKFGNKPEDFEQITNMIDAKLYGLFPEDGK